MKEQQTLQEMPLKQEIVSFSNEISLFSISGDTLLVESDSDYIKEEVNKLLIKTPSKIGQEMFLDEVFRSGMTKIQFARALKHAWNTPTYGDKGFMNAITSYDKTIKTFTYNGVLKLLNDRMIERTNDMVQVKFATGQRSYIYKSDYIKEIMQIAEPVNPEDKKERYYIDPDTKEKVIV